MLPVRDPREPNSAVDRVKLAINLLQLIDQDNRRIPKERKVRVRIPSKQTASTLAAEPMCSERS
jgi:hypothetical protein